MLAAILCASAHAQPVTQSATASNTPPPAQVQKQTMAGIDKLQSWYTQSTGLYQTTGWWNSANALTMLADYSLVARTASYTTVFSNSFQQAQKTNSGFLNNYYDDEGWWALAWIAAYDLTHTQQYLDMASSIFTDMSGGWDSTCGGGIWWSKDKPTRTRSPMSCFSRSPHTWPIALRLPIARAISRGPIRSGLGSSSPA
jgi:hypothetical protein